MSPAKKKSAPPVCVLTIAGSDSGGGAGIQADARAIHALGAFAATAVTAITAQNTRGISHWKPVTPQLLQQQISAVLADLPVHAIKTGLLTGVAAVQAVLNGLMSYPKIPLVVDPVMGSTSGTLFLPFDGLNALKKKLIPRATLVTPNWPEIEWLTGETLRTQADAERAGRRLIAETGCTAVLVKGGHAPGKTCTDLLIVGQERVISYSHPRIVSTNTHGTGCVLSAAIATRLAQKYALAEAVDDAIAFLQAALREGRGLDWGGRGPALA